ncbi:MAG: WD40 repeat domain-containing protein [Planctomycetes bacterium]|nr:WD40 repeat domain-containing protein [Planctomycetota bacterium]
MSDRHDLRLAVSGIVAATLVCVFLSRMPAVQPRAQPVDEDPTATGHGPEIDVPARHALIHSLPPLVDDAQAVSPNHTRIAVSTRDQGVWVIDIATKTVALTIPASGSVVDYIAWSSDSTTLALLRQGGVIEVFDAEGGEMRASLCTTPGLPDEIRRREIHFAAGDAVLIATLGGPPTDIFPAHGGKLIAQIGTGASRLTTAMALSRDGKLIALGDDGGTVAVWNALDGAPLPDITSVPLGKTFHRIHSLDFSPTGAVIAIGGGDCKVRLWKRDSAGPKQEFTFCDEDLFDNQAIGSARFSPDGTRLVATTFKYWDIRVWDVSTNDVVQWVDFGGGQARGIGAWFTTDGRFIFTDLACRVALSVGQDPTQRGGQFDPRRLIPGGWPSSSKFAFFQSIGDYAWAVVDHHLVVRKIPDEEAVLRIPVREK